MSGVCGVVVVVMCVRVCVCVTTHGVILFRIIFAFYNLAPEATMGRGRLGEWKEATITRNAALLVIPHLSVTLLSMRRVCI